MDLASEQSSKRYLLTLSLGGPGRGVWRHRHQSRVRAARGFRSEHEVLPTPQNVIGVLSLIVWSLITIISIKYLALVMRADNRGEGGISH